MVIIVIGTSAELIKMAPVVHQLKRLQVKTEIWWTGMHLHNIDELFEALQLDQPNYFFVNPHGEDVNSTIKAIKWWWRISLNFAKNRKRLIARLDDKDSSIFLVHGDTFTTVFGAIVAKLMKVRSGHVEAGYRSGKIFSPFPEELNRIIAARLVDIHFAPGDDQVRNLAGRSGVVLNTGTNTAIDSLRINLEKSEEIEVEVPETFILVTLHRFELLSDTKWLKETLHAINKIALKIPVLFFMGEHDDAVINKFENGILENVEIREKQTYLNFLPYLRKASAVITDSGGLQLECYYMGKPALIHRKNLEIEVGLGTSYKCSYGSCDEILNFVDNYETLIKPSILNSFEPSKEIAEYLEKEIRQS